MPNLLEIETNAKPPIYTIPQGDQWPLDGKLTTSISFHPESLCGLSSEVWISEVVPTHTEWAT